MRTRTKTAFPIPTSHITKLEEFTVKKTFGEKSAITLAILTKKVQLLIVYSESIASAHQIQTVIFLSGATDARIQTLQTTLFQDGLD